MPLYFIIWIHLVAAITFIGGLIYLHLVLRPVLRSHGSASAVYEISKNTAQRFRTVTWMSLIALILTGAFNMLSEGGSARIETMWGVVLMLKLFLFAVAFVLVLIHDFVIDPYAPSSQPSSEIAAQNLRRATVVQQSIIVLALIILLVATYLTVM